MFDLVDNTMLEVTIHGRALGQDVDNVLHYRVDALEGVVPSENALVAINERWEAEVLPILCAKYTHTLSLIGEISQVVLGPKGQPRFLFGKVDQLAPSLPGTGGIDSTPLPTPITVNATKKSAGTLSTIYYPLAPVPVPPTEKIFRGRIAVGIICESQTDGADGNLLEPGNRTAFSDALNEFLIVPVDITPSDRCDLVLQVASMVRNKAVRTAGSGLRTAAFQLVDEIVVQPNVGTQNSRKAKNVS
jgi:hypothetical protein